MIYIKYKKYVSTVILNMLMISVLASINVFADCLIGNCGDIVNYSFNEFNGLLTISGEGSMNNYSKENKAPWDSYYIRTVIVGSSVNNIGERAFSHCESLESIKIGNNVSSIGDYAFSCCKNLSTVIYGGDDEPHVGKFIFKDCTKLKKVEVFPEYIHHSFCGIRTKLIEPPFDLTCDYDGREYARWKKAWDRDRHHHRK